MSTVIDYDELLCSKSVCMSSSLLLPGKTCLNILPGEREGPSL